MGSLDLIAVGRGTLRWQVLLCGGGELCAIILCGCPLQAEVVTLGDEAAAMWDGVTSATELTVNLITGRTHQVGPLLCLLSTPIHQ